MIIGSDRRPETKQGIEEKIVKFRSRIIIIIIIMAFTYQATANAS